MAKQPATTDRRTEIAQRAKSFFDEAVEAQNDGDLAGAIAGYNKTLSLAPGYVSALNNLGVALRKDRKLDAAIALQNRHCLGGQPRSCRRPAQIGSV